MTTPPIFTRGSLVLAAAIFCGLLAAYGLTASRHFSPDSMAFATLITRDDTTSRLFFQAEHVLFAPVALAWYRLFQLFGWAQGALEPMQILSAASGALGVALLFLCLRLVLGKRRDAVLVSLLIALAAGGTRAYWYHSTEAEDQILANAIQIGAFLCLLIAAVRLRLDLTWADRAVSIPATAAMVLAALAALVHGTTILFVPALLVGLWQLRAPIQVLLRAIILVPAIILAVLVLVGWTALGLRTPADFLGWFLSAPGHGVWGQLALTNLLRAGETWVDAIVYLQGGPEFRALLRGSLEWRNLLALVTFLGAGAALLATVGYLVIHRQRSVQPWLVPVLLSWIVVYAVFNSYWAPEDIQFWMATMPPIAIAAAMTYDLLVRRFPNRGALVRSFGGLALALVVLLNLGTSALPRANLQANTGYLTAVCVGANVGEQDLVIGPGWDWTTSYIPYFTGRQAVGIVDIAVLEAGRDPAAVQRSLQDRVEATWAAGGRAYLVRLLSLNEEDRAWLEQAARFTPEQFPYPVRQAFSCGDEVVWEVQRG